MGAYIVFITIGIPCLMFLFWCLTPSGKKWLKAHNMLKNCISYKLNIPHGSNNRGEFLSQFFSLPLG